MAVADLTLGAFGAAVLFVVSLYGLNVWRKMRGSLNPWRPLFTADYPPEPNLPPTHRMPAEKTVTEPKGSSIFRVGFAERLDLNSLDIRFRTLGGDDASTVIGVTGLSDLKQIEAGIHSNDSPSYHTRPTAEGGQMLVYINGIRTNQNKHRPFEIHYKAIAGPWKGVISFRSYDRHGAELFAKLPFEYQPRAKSLIPDQS